MGDILCRARCETVKPLSYSNYRYKKGKRGDERLFFPRGRCTPKGLSFIIKFTDEMHTKTHGKIIVVIEVCCADV